MARTRSARARTGDPGRREACGRWRDAAGCVPRAARVTYSGVRETSCLVSCDTYV